MQVYDRWGTLVFERRDFYPNIPELGWDGRYKGNILRPAVYIYRVALQLSDGSTKWLDGSITLTN